MQTLSFFIIIFLLALVCIFALKIKELKNTIKILRKKIQDMEALGRGLSDYKDAQEDKKEHYKNIIMELLNKSGRITHREIQTQLEISEASADRYIQEMERGGKIKQEGEGRGTYYIKK